MATEYFNDAWRIPNNKNQSLVSNYSMQFDGSNDNITLDNTNDFLNVDYLTISIWFKPDVAENAALIGNRFFNAGYMSWTIQIFGNGKVRYLQRSPNLGTSFYTIDTYNLGEWNHIAVTYDSVNSAKMYLNGGSPVVNTNQTTPIQYGTDFISNNVTIGSAPAGGSTSSPTGPTQHFNGSIDQVSIFDYALPATGTNSIATLYGGGTAVTNPMALSPKPIAAYQLGDQSVDSGANYLVPNNSLQNYVFETSPSGSKYFTIPSITISTTATISIWFNIKTLGSVQQVTFGGTISNKLCFRLSTNLQILYFDTASSFASLVTGIPPTNFLNKWHHLALVQDDNGATVYIDNVYEGVIALRTPTFTNIGNFDGGSTTLNGFISNAAIFSTNLPATGTESIASLYNNGSPALDISSYSGLQRWYKLNAQDTFDGTNWTIKDYAGSNDGTSVNMTSANLIQSNLQHTSGFSPYALSLDRADGQRLRMSNGIQLGTNKAVSMWVKLNNGTNGITIILSNGSYQRYAALLTSSGYLTVSICEPTVCTTITTTYTIVNDVWFNLIISGDGTTATVYVNGQNSGQGTDRTPRIQDVGNYSSNLFGLDGDLSNLAVWQSNSLTSVEVTEIYNSGIPTNLNNFSGTKPTAWWQLGTNSSFNANTSQWTCLDEIGTNNISTATNDMSEDDIVNGVGYSANGLGTSSIEIIGSAPYSTANGISNSMDVLSRSTDLPPTV